jgi:hypothetical protein
MAGCRSEKALLQVYTDNAHRSCENAEKSEDSLLWRLAANERLYKHLRIRSAPRTGLREAAHERRDFASLTAVATVTGFVTNSQIVAAASTMLTTAISVNRLSMPTRWRIMAVLFYDDIRAPSGSTSQLANRRIGELVI